MIYCDKPYCVNSDGEKCFCSNVFIDDDGMCVSFEDYTERGDYQTQFFFFLFRNGIVGKKRLKGKQITHKGFVFYTLDNVLTLDFERLTVTEARTGVFCGTIQKINDNWNTFCERIPKLPSVDELPEVESFCADGHLEYVETPTAAEMVQAQKYIEAVNDGNCDAGLD